MSDVSYSIYQYNIHIKMPKMLGPDGKCISFHGIILSTISAGLGFTSPKGNFKGVYIYIPWVWPLPSSSDHQDYSIFGGESPSTFIWHCYWEGATPNIYHTKSSPFYTLSPSQAWQKMTQEAHKATSQKSPCETPHISPPKFLWLIHIETDRTSVLYVPSGIFFCEGLQYSNC